MRRSGRGEGLSCCKSALLHFHLFCSNAPLSISYRPPVRLTNSGRHYLTRARRAARPLFPRFRDVSSSGSWLPVDRTYSLVPFSFRRTLTRRARLPGSSHDCKIYGGPEKTGIFFRLVESRITLPGEIETDVWVCEPRRLTLKKRSVRYNAK